MKFNLNITASKIYAFMGLLFAFVLSLIFKDPSIFTTVFIAGAGLVGGKMIKEHYDKRENNKGSGHNIGSGINTVNRK